MRSAFFVRPFFIIALIINISKQKRLFYLLSAYLIVAEPLSAQIQIGPSQALSAHQAGKFKPGALADFKERITVFTLPEAERQHTAEYEKELQKVWTITKFIVCGLDEVPKYANDRYNIFLMGVQEVQRGNSVYTFVTYDLFALKEKGTELYARVAMYPREVPDLVGKALSNKASDKSARNALAMLYGKTEIFNFSVQDLKAYAGFINKSLLSGREQGIFSNIDDKVAIKALKGQTVYLLEHTKRTVNKFTGKEGESALDLEKINSKLPFTVAYATKDALREHLAKGERFYYINTIQASNNRYVFVIDSEGQVIYNALNALSFQFKEKDLEEIAKELR